MAAADNLTTAGRVPAFEKQLKQLKDGMKAVISGHKSVAKAHKTLKENVDKAQTREPYADLEKALGRAPTKRPLPYADAESALPCG